MPLSTTMSPETIAEAKARLLAEADQAHAAHAQYKGYWDNWVVARAKKRIVQRGVEVAAKGDLVLLDPASVKPFGQDDPFDLVLAPKNAGKVSCTVYFAKSLGGCNTSRWAHEFEVVA